ncbi:hypothetical protein AYI69_g5883 [Smittium culicis]|uniref:ADF-H domain-containing protein n=1 Tax=Smittium culicis TaxID=133412 RepID=A0A1R1Y3G6_9FUNG|nr:hypothetical protein AYI69_g5883 [Smittium culicis]
MMYASTQGQIKQKVGFARLAESLQISEMDELAIACGLKAPEISKSHISSPQSSKIKVGSSNRTFDPRSAMSQNELQKLQVLHDEDLARNDLESDTAMRLKQISLNAKSRFAPASYSSNHSSEPNEPLNVHQEYMHLKSTIAAKTGGFHSIEIPISNIDLDKTADSLSSNDKIWIEFEIANKKDCILKSESPNSDSINSLTKLEPRFLIAKLDLNTIVFIQSIPETSVLNLRMVYSSSANSIMSQIIDRGIRITHKVGIYSNTRLDNNEVKKLIADGTAKKIDNLKSVEEVLKYRPQAPARSVPSRFVFNSEYNSSINNNPTNQFPKQKNTQSNSLVAELNSVHNSKSNSPQISSSSFAATKALFSNSQPTPTATSRTNSLASQHSTSVNTQNKFSNSPSPTSEFSVNLTDNNITSNKSTNDLIKQTKVDSPSMSPTNELLNQSKSLLDDTLAIASLSEQQSLSLNQSSNNLSQAHKPVSTQSYRLVDSKNPSIVNQPLVSENSKNLPTNHHTSPQVLTKPLFEPPKTKKLFPSVNQVSDSQLSRNTSSPVSSFERSPSLDVNQIPKPKRLNK